ncbi:MAG: tRNA pseudouridine(55) synthase TruB [Candidatus Omnitrophica bacterium]|nr:tRNA pseudouridine(55) synthase TruB [Candidatus Omnitrophota bacterium]
MKDGILVVNKPKGITSHDVVDYVRRQFHIKQVGHAGTLDPMATGVLIILIGRCTKLFDSFLGLDKEYVATLSLGKRTESGDVEGAVIEEKDFSHVNEDKIRTAAAGFIGKKEQIPPMVSALKFRGKRLYSLARKGKEVQRKPRSIIIKDLKILKLALPDIQFQVTCSRGTYIRTLAEDIAVHLDTVGCVSQIERQAVGPFHIKDAFMLSDITEDKINPCPVGLFK